MTTFALTGATGLIGSNLVWEIVKNNLDHLDQIRILWFGRASAEDTLMQRITQMVETEGWQYFSPEYDQALVQQVCSIIQPIDMDLRLPKLGISQEDYEILTREKIDYFYHLAACSDLRSTPAAEIHVPEVNLEGTNRILELLDSLPHKVGQLVYVSSAYVCGKTYGDIAPTYVNLDQQFRNPYEKTKLEAECICRTFCQERNIPLKVFRPSIVGGRIMEDPLGHVNKFDVFYSWIAFFVQIKKRFLPHLDGHEIYEIPVEIPIRIQVNPQCGLNIVSADLCAKVLYSAATTEHPATSYHLVSSKNIPSLDLLHTIGEAINILGCSITDQMPQHQNIHERLYYRTVGSVFTPYFSEYPMLFDNTSMIDVCDRANISPVDIDRETIKLILDYAKQKDFGLHVNGKRPIKRYRRSLRTNALLNNRLALAVSRN